MNKFQQKSWNRLVYNKSVVVAELPATTTDLRRWVAIYPNVVKSPNLAIPEHKYSILDFELEASKMEEYVGNEDLIMRNKSRLYLIDEEQLLSTIDQLNIDASLFDTPWKYDYPL